MLLQGGSPYSFHQAYKASRCGFQTFPHGGGLADKSSAQRLPIPFYKEVHMDEQKRVTIEAYDKLGKPAWKAVVDGDAETVGRKMTEYLERGLIPVVRWLGQTQSAGEKLALTIADIKKEIDRKRICEDKEDALLHVEWKHEDTSFMATGPEHAVLEAQSDLLYAAKDKVF